MEVTPRPGPERWSHRLSSGHRITITLVLPRRGEAGATTEPPWLSKKADTALRTIIETIGIIEAVLSSGVTMMMDIYVRKRPLSGV